MIVAACVVGTSVLLVYVYILDAIDRNRRSITIVGSGSKKSKIEFFKTHTQLCGGSLGVVFCAVFNQTHWDP